MSERALCEFCGDSGDTRLMWSDERQRKVRVCRSLSACFDRVTAPIRALATTCASAHHKTPVPVSNGTDRCDECWHDAMIEQESQR